MLRYFLMLIFLANISSAFAEPIVVEEKMTDSESLQRAREKVNQSETPTSIVGGMAKKVYEDMKWKQISIIRSSRGSQMVVN